MRWQPYSMRRFAEMGRFPRCPAGGAGGRASVVPLLGGVERFVESLHVPLGFSGLNWMGGGGHSLSCGLGMQQIV